MFHTSPEAGENETSGIILFSYQFLLVFRHKEGGFPGGTISLTGVPVVFLLRQVVTFILVTQPVSRAGIHSR